MFNLKIFQLPTPKELGKSNNNNLPFKFLSKPEDYCWEDWEEEVKDKYPIKYMIVKTIPRIWIKIKNLTLVPYNYIKYNYFKRYHMLDLRQPKGACERDEYRYGYSDPCERFLYAGFNLLVEFVEKELIDIDKLILSMQDCIENSDEWLKDNYKFHLEIYKEIKVLYSYWKRDRKIVYLENKILFEICNKSKLEEDRKKWREAELKFDKDEQDMFLRLAKIRECMWS
jgi:hypothetical protein